MTMKIQKPPTVPYRFLRPDSDVGQSMYALLQQLVDAHHREIADARIALAWQTSWTPDADGHVTLGQCRKVSELEREVADLLAYDFVILLRQEFWLDPLTTDLQRRALLDHELEHASVKLDDHGDPVENERGRVVYRIRKHDVEDFACIAERYGAWKRDLQVFAERLDRARSRAHEWVGYTRVREALLAAGAVVSIDVIAQWTEAERREAEVWAILQAAATGPAGRPTCPDHVRVATDDGLQFEAPIEPGVPAESGR
jgi:hypothetical protein